MPSSSEEMKDDAARGKTKSVEVILVLSSMHPAFADLRDSWSDDDSISESSNKFAITFASNIGNFSADQRSSVLSFVETQIASSGDHDCGTFFVCNFMFTLQLLAFECKFHFSEIAEYIGTNTKKFCVNNDDDFFCRVTSGLHTLRDWRDEYIEFNNDNMTLFTITFDYDGGTFTEQVFAPTPGDAIFAWAEKVSLKDMDLDETQRDKVIVIDRDGFLVFPLDSLCSVWRFSVTINDVKLHPTLVATICRETRPGMPNFRKWR